MWEILEDHVVRCISFFHRSFFSPIFKPRSLQPQQSGGRDKFVPLDSHLAPFSIPAWSAALQEVDRSLVAQPTRNYAFPEPGLFVSPATDKKAK
jgi:hypothetical protein